MKFLRALAILGTVGAAAGQSGEKAIVINPATAVWEYEKGSAEGAEGVMIRTDPATGGMDLLVRFPGGHVIAPHYHDSNERIFVAEGRVTLRQDAGDAVLNVGGFAFLPAHEVQRMSCSSKTRCTFYLSWDGKHESHPAK
jgi:quercetin dioxygenase-like cupin family protein